MLGKLLKYDLKWIYKIVVIFYALALVFSLIGRGLISIENSLLFEILGKICFGIAISMMINGLVNGLIRAWVRFMRNIYKDESYLTHTLPVEKKTIYASKVLSAIITSFTSTLVIIVCLFICYYSKTNMEILKGLLEVAASTYNTTILNLLLIISVVLFIEVIFIILIGYVGIIIGHKFNQNKMLKSILVGFGLYMLTQVFTIILIGIYGLISPDIMNLINTTETVDIQVVKNIMYIATGVYTVYAIIYYILGKKQLEKGVNVD